MQRSTFIFACISSLIVGCATATDDGAPTATHDSGVHGADTRGGFDAGSGDDASSATTTDAGSEFDSSSPPDDTATLGDDTGTSDALSDPACAASTSNNDCEMCCYTAHTDAYNAFADALSSCACKPGNCDTACGATACASPPSSADPTCLSCLKSVQTGACKADVDAVCAKPSGACYPFARCVITSGCNSKP
jgi:hypothetical protein